MKKSILIVLLLTYFSCLYAANNDQTKKSIQEYDTLFQQIAKKRIGITNKNIDKIKNPFFVIDKSKVLVENISSNSITYTLNAILSNKAKINSIWYKLNSDVGDFKLTKINSKSVIIKNEHSKKELFIRKSDDGKIKFSSK